MKVRGREREAFNFIDILKSFVNSNDAIDDDIEKELDEIKNSKYWSILRKIIKTETLSPLLFLKDTFYHFYASVG